MKMRWVPQAVGISEDFPKPGAPYGRGWALLPAADLDTTVDERQAAHNSQKNLEDVEAALDGAIHRDIADSGPDKCYGPTDNPSQDGLDDLHVPSLSCGIPYIYIISHSIDKCQVMVATGLAAIPQPDDSFVMI